MDAQKPIIEIMTKPYWLIDVLPKQVPADAAGQYFKIEPFLLSRLESICSRFSSVLLKLNCYCDLQVSADGETWTLNPEPEELEQAFRRSITSHSPLFVLIQPGEAMATFSGDDHYMTLYNPDTELVDLVRQLAAAEGLFVWGPKQTEP